VTLNQQNAQTCSLDIYSIILHLIFLDVSVEKGPSSWNQMDATLHNNKLATLGHSRHGIKESGI